MLSKLSRLKHPPHLHPLFTRSVSKLARNKFSWTAPMLKSRRPLFANGVSRRVGWWAPPRQGGSRGGDFDDEGGGGAGDKYVYKMQLEKGQRVEYDVKVEDRQVTVRGRVVDSGPNRRYEHSFSRTHVLPEDVDLSTVHMRFDHNGDLVITARYFR